MMTDEITEPDMIRHQMEQTRESLQSKLETLEQQVKDTVQEATGAVTDTVEAVKETVENVKETVQGTVESVKDTVQDTVDTMRGTVHDTVQSVKNTLDFSSHVQEHPWLMFAGATMVGYAAGRLLSRNFSRGSAAIAAAPSSSATPSDRNNGYSPPNYASSIPQEPKRTWWDTITDHYGEEIDKLKGLVLGTVGGVAREMLVANVAPVMTEQVKEMVDSFTTKLGGHVIEGPILQSFAGHDGDDEEHGQANHEARPEKETVSGRW